MNLICKILGHNWDETGLHEQGCKRKNCGAFRTICLKKYPEFGEPASGWKTFEELNFKKL